jgi:uncharacterized protein
MRAANAVLSLFVHRPSASIIRHHRLLRITTGLTIRNFPDSYNNNNCNPSSSLSLVSGPAITITKTIKSLRHFSSHRPSEKNMGQDETGRTPQENNDENLMLADVLPQITRELERFYKEHPEIKESHGLVHVMAVYHHAYKAVKVHQPPLSSRKSMEIQVAAFLHDVDDSKYFSLNPMDPYPNAAKLMTAAFVPESSRQLILEMISLVSASVNGNHVPEYIKNADKDSDNNLYHLLIPRWSDRLEAVGAIGVIRCYQYNQEKERPLWSETSPRPKTVQEMWDFALPERFERYMSKEPVADDMISHYYDKLLHVARPPPDSVRNPYLERKAAESCEELIEVCLRFGRTGVVDEEYIQSLVDKVKE